MCTSIAKKISRAVLNSRRNAQRSNKPSQTNRRHAVNHRKRHVAVPARTRMTPKSKNRNHRSDFKIRVIRGSNGDSMTKTLIALILFTSAVVAQQIGNPTTQDGVLPPRGTIAIRNARIVTVSGPDIENGTVVIREGKIEAVGTNVSVPAGAQ